MSLLTADLGKNVMRKRYAPDWPLIQVAVDSATVIKIGDLLWLDDDDAKPASDVTWVTDEDTTRGNFTAKFLGVAMSASKDGDVDDVVVLTIGIVEYDINLAPSADLEIGTLVGPAKATGDAILSQVLKNAATAKGIGMLVKVCKTTDTTMLVHIRGAYVPPPAS